MQGFQGMLKAMGIDPDKMRADAEQFLRDARETRDNFHARLLTIETALANAGFKEFAHLREQFALLEVNPLADEAEKLTAYPPPPIHIDGE